MEMLVWVALLLSVCTQTHAQNGRPRVAEQCKDSSPQCPNWAQQGRCLSSPDYMLSNCPRSCSACPVPECYDRSQRCSTMAAHGNCRTQPNYMLDICPRACGKCGPEAPLGPTRSRPRTIVSPRFDCGRGRTSPSTAGGANRRDRGSGGANRRDRGSGGDDGTIADVVDRRVGREVIFPDDPRYSLFRLGGWTRNPGARPPDTQTPARLTDTAPTRTVDTDTSGKLEVAAPNVTNVNVGDTFCGATPITNHFIITAAHCVLNPDNPVHTVRLGELDFADDNEANSRPVDYQVAEIFVHPDYKYKTLERYNDVALILTTEKIIFDDLVFPYCLSVDRPAPKTVVTGAGFGLVNQTFRSTRLQEAELEVVGTAECEDIYRREDVEIRLRIRYPELLGGRDILCAAYPMRDACQGDSGGPLFLDRDSRRYLLGIVGTGVPCQEHSESVQPGLYVSVADHIDFIDSIIYGNQ